MEKAESRPPRPATTTTKLQDLGLWKRLRGAGIQAPFVRSLFGPTATAALPAFHLVTPDGRMLMEGRFERGIDRGIAERLADIVPRAAHQSIIWPMVPDVDLRTLLYPQLVEGTG